MNSPATLARTLLSLVLIFLITLPSFAQDRQRQGREGRERPTGPMLIGRVIDASAETPLPGVNVIAVNQADSTQRYGNVTNARGVFRVDIPNPGTYTVRISFVGYLTQEQTHTVAEAPVRVGQILLEEDVVAMDELRVEAVQDRVIIRGDTTEYNAEAYKVNPDATAEDLIAKMPGVVIENGEVQAEGEQVQRVLVDGREFFGTDPSAALRNLPAETIDRIQVFDRMSDQAQFTGFDDGNTEKTINIVTQSGRSNGQFGKLYGGYGSEERYITGGNVNLFDDDRRISIIGLSNNVNQQNFAMQDILGVVGQTGRGGFGGGAGIRRGGGGNRGGGGRPQGGFGRDRGRTGDPGNFLIGGQNGVNTTTSVGLNYTDNWGSNTEVSGSYFFNLTKNTTIENLDREYLLTGDAVQLYNESNNAESDNYNHRFNMRLEHTLGERDELVFTPRVSFQNNNATSILAGSNLLGGTQLLSTTDNDFLSDNAGYTATSSLLWRHRFAKQGRTVSTNLTLGLNDRDGDSDLYAAILYDDDDALDQITDQQTINTQRGLTLSGSLNYTEPIGERGQLQLNYRPSISNSDADRTTNLLDERTGIYSILDPVLSSQFDSETLQNRGGISYRMNRGTLSWSVGVDAQQTDLTGDQVFPFAFDVNRSFFDVLPEASFTIRQSRTSNLRINYRTSTNTPSIAQLQPVIDNTNPLQLTSGNPDLSQSYSHSLFARYRRTDRAKGRVFFGLIALTQTQDYIGSESTIALQDQPLDQGLTLQQGAQYTRPVNMDGYWSARSFAVFGSPLDVIKSNLNVNGGYTYARTPGLINSVENISDVHTIRTGLSIGSNISERVDFSLRYNLNLSRVSNSVFPELDADYAQHQPSAQVTILPGGNWLLESSFSALAFSGLGDDFDQTSLLWSAGFGYKFLQANSGEIKLVVSDILNQATNITRTVNELYIEDNLSNVLGRYLLLNFTYTLRNYR
ncbi:MAG: TonB-dependent receptor [Bacteroidota bacterium]